MPSTPNPPEGPPDHNFTHFIFLIHGTWGRDSDGWYRPSSTGKRFADRLAARLEGTPLAGAVWRDIEVFEWSGDNTHAARLEAADQLTDLLFTIRKHDPRTRFHFVAHSHGGNVVLRAIQNYIHGLPLLTLNRLGFPNPVRDDETRREFFAAAKRFIEFWNTHHGQATIARDVGLYEDARQWNEDLKDRGRFRRYMAGNFMILRLAHILLRLGTHPEEHGILSVAFLGTPFYYKRWKSRRISRLLAQSMAGVAQFILVGIAAYVVLLSGGALLAAVSTVPGPGIHPLDWHWALQLVLLTVAAWSGIQALRKAIVTVDTNLYFDETMFEKRAGAATAFTEMEDRALFNALVISSGFLDEALAGLASIPWLGRSLPGLMDGFLKPLKWNFSPVTEPTGRVRSTVDKFVIQPLRRCARRLLASLNWILYPIRVSVYRLLTRPIALSQAARVSLPLAYGLPRQEFVMSEIQASEDLDIGQINVQKIDVARDLMTAHPSPSKADAKRFEFLWDDQDLAKRWAGSVAAKQFGGDLPSEARRNLLAVEERLREVYGVAGLRHSLYYESPKVLETIAEYLIANNR